MALSPLFGALVHGKELNQLVHPAGYKTAPLGTLGRVAVHGSGPVSLILIPGLGFDGSVFDAFAAGWGRDYRILTVTPAGMGGTPAPPMPPPGTSYGEQTWTRGAVRGLVSLIEERRLERPVVVGHLGGGSLVALRLAAEHPELVGGVVLVAGEVARELSPGQDAVLADRVRAVDDLWAARWFRTVDRETWNLGMWPPEIYSRDPVQGEALWRTMASVPVPVMVRYLCEFMAADMRDAVADLRVPLRWVVPGWSGGIAEHPRRPVLDRFFSHAPRDSTAAGDRVIVEDSHLFVTHDQPKRLQAVIEEFIAEIGVLPPSAPDGAGDMP